MILGFMLFAGCGSDPFSKGTGDAGKFILQKAVAHGARLISTNDLPVLEGKWRFLEDKNGAVIQLSRERYIEVESLLRRAFGQPGMEPCNTTDGGKLGVYAAKDIGAGIQFGYEKDITQVTILRGMEEEELIQGMREATQKKP